MKIQSILLSIFFIFIGFLWGYQVHEIYQEPEVKKIYPTGYDILNEVNSYRHSQGKEFLELYKPLCNNIVSRYHSYKETDSHFGLEAFVQKYMPEEKNVAEVLAQADTAKETIQLWANSPSHNILILEATKGCAYSYQGYSVMLLK